MPKDGIPDDIPSFISQIDGFYARPKPKRTPSEGKRAAMKNLGNRASTEPADKRRIRIEKMREFYERSKAGL